VVESSALEHRLPSGHPVGGNLERVQHGVTERDQRVAASSIFAIADYLRVENSLVESDQPIDVGSDESDVVGAAD